MTRKNGGTRKNRKRKGKELADEDTMPSLRNSHHRNLHSQHSFLNAYHPLPLNGPPIGQSSSQVQRVLNMAAPLGLTLSGLEQIRYSLPGDSRNPNDAIDQILRIHNEHMKNVLHSTVGKLAEEIMALSQTTKGKELFLINKKLSQIAETEAKLKTYTGQIDRLSIRFTGWEKTIETLEKKLRKLTQAQAGSSDVWWEEGAQSFRQAVEPVRLECTVCVEHVATVMFWPCRHVCICTSCNTAGMKCTICKMERMTYIELSYPTYD